MTDDEKAIHALQRNWLAACSKGDVIELVSYMTEDVVFLRPGKPPMGRQEFMDEFITAMHHVSMQCNGTFEEVSVSGDIAYCRARLNVTVTPKSGGRPTQMQGYTLSVFRKFAPGDWLLVRDANLLTPVSSQASDNS